VRRILLPLVVAALFSASLPAQTAQTTSPTGQARQGVRDSAALAAVQTALNALGGATAISQIQSWTFQATMGWGDGTIGQQTVSYTLDTQPSSFTIVKGGVQSTVYIRSYFVPVVLAAVLASQVQEPRYSVQPGQSAAQGNPGSTVSFSLRPVPNVDQLWHFDGTTGLPVSVEFHRPARLGSHISRVGVIQLSNYQSVGGVLYPFKVVTMERGMPPRTITIQLITPSAAAPTAPPSGRPQPGDTL
jgi:hypothetical protein